MKLFRSKQKEEVINVDLNKKLLSKEKSFSSNDNEDLQPTKKLEIKTREELEKEIQDSLEVIQNRSDNLTNQFYICRILSRVGLKDLDFNLQVIGIEKHINRLKKECFDIKRKFDNSKAGLILSKEEIEEIHKKMIDLVAFQNGLLNQLQEINNTSYGHLKISTVSVCLSKSNLELENLYNNINLELKPFKSFSEAAEYIYFNSGDFIDNLINQLLNYIKQSDNKNNILLYNHNYFLSSDVIVTLEVKEWIELYNKIKFVLKIIGKYNEAKHAKLKKVLDEFEAKYAILMMRTESHSGRII